MSRLERWSHGYHVWRRFGSHLRDHRRALAVVVLLTLVGVATDLARPWPIQWIFDNALVPDGPRPHAPLFYILTGAGALLAISAASAGLGYLATLQTTRVSHAVTRSLRGHIFAHLCRLSPSYHARHKAGDLLVRLMGDVPILRTMLVDSSVAIASRALLIVGTLTVLLIVDPLLTLAVVAVLPLVAAVVKLISGRLTVAVRKQRRKEGALADYLHEALGATPLIQSMGREAETAREFARGSRTAARAEMKTARLAARMSASVESLLGLALAVGLGLGAWRVVRGELTPGVLLAFLSYVRSLAKPLRSASRHADKVAKGTACGDRVLTVLDAPIEIQSPADSLPVPARPERLVLRDVHFSYPDGTPALRGVDARFERGHPVAVFGHSGSGKSTLAALAIRLYDPTSGAVELDGVDLRRYDLGELRARFGVSLQQTFLFGSTLRENLELGRADADDPELWDALRKAGADGFVRALPDGLDTLLGASGVGLSGGERKRVCLARALLRGAPVTIVDEPFAGLDREAARRVLDTLTEVARERVVLVITHEREHLDLFDQVLFLEDGRVRGAGRHAELMERDDAYRRMAGRTAEAAP